ncbi:hypothetical protein [Methylobacterium sp. CM6246]
MKLDEAHRVDTAASSLAHPIVVHPRMQDQDYQQLMRRLRNAHASQRAVRDNRLNRNS